MIARGLRSRCPTPAQPVVQLLAPAVQLLQELPSHFLADGGDRVAKGRPVPVEVPPQGLRQPRRAEVAACRIGHGLPNPGEAHVGGPQLPRREALAEAGVPLSDWEDHDSDDALAAGFVELLDSIFVESVPAARRLMQLLEERGWSGWTQLEPVTTEARR